jgi:DNA polymerase (family 10)
MKIEKNLTNLKIADLLRSVAAAYKIKGRTKNKFRIIAYERAADAVEHLSSEAKDLWDDNKLESVAGIGESIAEHLGEIFKTGRSAHFNSVFNGIPPAVFELIPISGIGPVTAYKLVTKLKISSNKPVEQLLNAGKAGKIEKLDGFGKDSQDSIIKSIKEYQRRKKRLLLNYASNIANGLIGWIKKCDKVGQVEALGSLRRKASTIGDIDIAVSSDDKGAVVDWFIKYEKTQRVLEKGTSTASIMLPGEIQADIKVQRPDTFGSLLQHFTGSKHHNIALREYAIKKGMKLSEYSIKITGKKKEAKTKKFGNEKEFYQYLGMEWIPPELREDTGEIEAALSGGLPQLVDISEIKSDLQIHSSFNTETSHDLGESTMEKIIKKAGNMGYEYLAFTEHNPSRSGHSSKQIMEILKKKKDKIEKVNNKQKKLKRVFNSLEIDILPDGRLPIPEKGFDLLDFALVSVHSSFRQSRKEMTKRVLSALNNPKVKIFAHPTARKLNQREGVELNWPEIFEYCKKNDKWLEINADPMRLDLPDSLVRDAVREGVLLTLGTDAHHADMLENIKYGVAVARRGWAKKQDIVNTRNFEEFKKMIN